MAFELDRRRFIGTASVAAATTVLGGGLLAGPARAGSVAVPQSADGPVLTLRMGVPEVDPNGRAAPYRQTVCPGRNMRDHGDWWTY